MTMRRNLLLGGAGAALAAAGYLVGTRITPPPPAAATPPTAAEPLPTEVELSPEAARNFGIVIGTAERQPLRRTIRATGMVGFNELRMAQVTAMGRGRIQAIETAVGDQVRAGQRLIVLDAPDLAEARHNLSTAEAGLRQAQAEAATSRAALQRAVDLTRGGALAQSEVDRRRADLARAEASLQTRATEAEHWREILARYNPTRAALPGPDAITAAAPADALGALVAPFDGTVMALGAAAGELIEPGRAIVTLADLSVLWVQADLPEREIGGLQQGAAVSVTVPAFPGRRFTGTVARVADQLDARTGTLRVRCALPNRDGVLRVNMFATVEIEAQLGREGVLVPSGALQTVDNEPVVFVALSDTRFARRNVRPGDTRGDLTEIAEGLQAGERVATQGSFRLKALLLRSRFAGEE